MRAYLSTPLDRTEHIFVLGRLPRKTERSYLPDKGLNLRRTLFLFAYGLETHRQIFRMHRLDMAYSSSVFGPFDIFVKPSRRLVGSIKRTFFIFLSRFFRRSPALVPIFYEKARISLMGSSKRRRPRNSRWATSIFLLKINGHADTHAKRKKLLRSTLSFLRSYRTSILSKRSYGIIDESCCISLSSLFLFLRLLFYPYIYRIRKSRARKL